VDADEPEPVQAMPVDTFDHFFRAEVGPVQRSLTITLGDADLAAEATAEAMARAYARWPKVSAYDNPAAWVYRVGLNWATSRWRKHRREVLTGRDPDRSTDATTVADPELARAIAHLDVDQRAVVVLRYQLDWSEADTAAALGIAPGTVKSRLSRALARLAEMLEDPHGRPA
jgi:RNA polymerase sigma-70 factor (ECF subfamily)